MLFEINAYAETTSGGGNNRPNSGGMRKGLNAVGRIGNTAGMTAGQFAAQRGSAFGTIRNFNGQRINSVAAADRARASAFGGNRGRGPQGIL